MKKLYLLHILNVFFVKSIFATVLIPDNNFLSLASGENTIVYSGQVAVPIETLNTFINSISHWNNIDNVWETYNPNNSSNSLLKLNPNKTYLINANQSFRIAFVALNLYDDVYDSNYSSWQTSNWVKSAYTYFGNNEFLLSILDPYLMRIWKYESMDHLLANGNPESEWSSIPPKLYTPGSPFNSINSFSEGGVYIPVGLSEVDSTRAVLIPYTVPEPSALSLLAFGLGVLFRRSRKRD